MNFVWRFTAEYKTKLAGRYNDLQTTKPTPPDDKLTFRHRCSFSQFFESQKRIFSTTLVPFLVPKHISHTARSHARTERTRKEASGSHDATKHLLQARDWQKSSREKCLLTFDWLRNLREKIVSIQWPARDSVRVRIIHSKIGHFAFTNHSKLGYF